MLPYVADEGWNMEAQLDVLRNWWSNELRDHVQHTINLENIVEFAKLCSKRDAQLRARAAVRKSGRWKGGYKKPETMTNNTSFLEAAPAGMVAGYHGPAPMDLSVVLGQKKTLESRKRRREEGHCMDCGDSTHFAASCARKLMAALGQLEVTPLWDSERGKQKEVVQKRSESGKV
jgi:hypothetical protein